MQSRLPDKLPSLDSLRGIAIALVFVHNTNIAEPGNSLIGQIGPRIASIGWVGVQLFFVLSGFLITRYLLDKQGTPRYFRNFYGRRILRIFPLYFSTLAFFFVLLPLTGYVPQGIRDDQPHQIWYWLFLSNWTEFTGRGGLSLPHLWSICVEEQFYLLWPLVVCKTSPTRLLKICAAIALLSLYSRFLMAAQEVNEMVIYTSSIARVDSLALGAAVAALFATPGMLEKISRRRGMVLATGLSLAILGKVATHNYGHSTFVGETWTYGILALVFACILTWAVASETVNWPGWSHRILSMQPLQILGKYSYGLYIFHVPLHIYIGLKLLACVGWQNNPDRLQTLTYLALLGLSTATLAWVSFHILEKRFLAMKRYFV